MKQFMKKIRTIENKSLGKLSFFEVETDISFDIKRIYYVYSVNEKVIRGNHAHKKTNQLLWCPHGSIEIELDNGIIKDTFVLDNPNKALIVLRGYWHTMVWKKKDSILCVAASDVYSEDDYIRNYLEFKEYVKRGYWSEN